MRIAHFSDTHLGFEQYAARTDQGLNQRMVDVVETFQRFLDSIADADPDVVIHAGDFFHQVRPKNLVIVTAFRKLWEFQEKRGHKPLIIVAGNHDSPKSNDAGNILRIFGDAEQTKHSIPGVHVVAGRASRCSFEEIGLEALCLPWGASHENLSPVDRSKTCVLVAHGLEGSLDVPGATLSLSRMNHDQWDYVALGDWHDQRRLTDRVWYSGSTDFTSTNYWEEEPAKGWLLFDSAEGSVSPVRVEPVRAVVPLPPIEALGLSGLAIGEQLLSNAHWAEDERPLVRQLVTNCSPAARAEVPHEVLSELRARALHYQYDPRLEARKEVAGSDLPRGATLEEDWTMFAKDRTLPLHIDREQFVETGRRLLKEADHDPEED